MTTYSDVSVIVFQSYLKPWYVNILNHSFLLHVFRVSSFLCLCISSSMLIVIKSSHHYGGRPWFLRECDDCYIGGPAGVTRADLHAAQWHSRLADWGSYHPDMGSIPFCQFQFHSIPFGQFQFHLKFINSNSIPIPKFSIPIPTLFLLNIFYHE